MLLRPAVHVLCSLAIVAGTLEMGYIGWSSSPQAEQAGYSVANTISSAVDLFSRNLVMFASFICTLVPVEWISVDKCLLKSLSGRLNDLDRC